MHHEEHDHEYMHAHNIPHEHPHDHEHEHDHPHGCPSDKSQCGGGCAGCGDPMAELVALMDYMVKHNTAHANELAQLAKRLGDMGNRVAFDQVMSAVSDFEKGNMRLTAVLASLKSGK